MDSHGDGGGFPAEGRDPTDGRAADRLVSDALVADAADQRRRRHWAGVVSLDAVDAVSALLGARDPVTLHVSGVGALGATVRGVGADVVEVSTPTGRSWIALAAVDAVETAGAVHGDPADRHDVTLAGLIADLIDSGEPVTVRLRSGAALHGEVLHVGEALLLGLATPRRTAVIAMTSVATVDRATRP